MIRAITDDSKKIVKLGIGSQAFWVDIGTRRQYWSRAQRLPLPHSALEQERILGYNGDSRAKL